MTRTGILAAGLAAALSAAAAEADAGPPTWSQWGGPSRDFTVGAAPLSWAGGAPAVVWRRPLGPGYAGIVGDGERLYTMTRRGAEEVILALAAGDGATVWEHAYPAPVEPGHHLDTTWGSGPNGTPLLAGGRLYTLGFTGVVSCVDAAAGELIWRRDLGSELGARLPYFGHATSPIRFGDTVIVVAGSGGVVALGLEDGELVWQNRGLGGSYASPALWEGPDPVQLVVPAAGEIVALDPRDGRLLWRHEHANDQRTILSGAVLGADRRLFASAYFLGAVGLELAADGGSVTELWESPRLQLSTTNAIRVGPLVYGFHNSILTAIDAASGEIAWRSRELERGNLVRVGERFLLLDRWGHLALLSLGAGGVDVHARAQILEGRSWTAPTLIGSRLYARNLEAIVAVDLGRPGGAAVAAERRPPPPVRLPDGLGSAAERLLAAYRTGDPAALAEAAGALERWAGEPEAGHLASYYLGFAAFERALLDDGAALGHLREAERRLTAAVERRPDFADAHALLSRVFPMYYRFDRERAAVVGPMGDEHLASALRFAPDSPRVLAIQGLDLVYSPPQYGGDPAAGIELLERAIAGFGDEASSPYPNWGRATVWAWYGRALLASDPPDRARAAAAARAALAIEPDLALARRLLEQAAGER